MPNRTHRRRSIRLPGYDYTQPGAYVVTICTHERVHLFGKVVDGEMRLNTYGEIVREEWFRTAEVRPNVELLDDEFVIMPNHTHGITWIVDVGTTHWPVVGGQIVGVQRRCAPTSTAPTKPNVAPGSLGAIIRSFKSTVTRRVNTLRTTPGAPVWQRNYWEHVIRDERALDCIRRYIAHNPLRWHLDRYNDGRVGPDPWATGLSPDAKQSCRIPISRARTRCSVG